MGELELIAALLPYLAGRGGDLVIGAGEDDAAAWREPDGSFTVATCDTSVEGVHFDLSRQRPEDVGWRALCFALGDLAAKGARPTFGLVSLSVPRRWGSEVALRLYQGMSGLAERVGLRLVGGDTTAAPHDGSLTLTLLGTTPIQPLPRSAARPGWEVGVTGPLGGASLEWARPEPRLELGAQLAAAGLCCGDVSDGLLREMDKFAAAAGVGARLRLDAVPLAPGVDDPRRALASGEEVELVCCGPGPLPAELTAVGGLIEGGEVIVIDAHGRMVEVGERGYDHLR
ncbi:MAG TPA: thiamine-phosphate kinase [Candidatus Dormibacteraeota bacterium]|nr:thiamine-phosphate kinase [Candidatus Dormibacteraeota bacterium]